MNELDMATEVERMPVAWRYMNEKSNSWNYTGSAVVADVMREQGRLVDPLFTHHTEEQTWKLAR